MRGYTICFTLAAIATAATACTFDATLPPGFACNLDSDCASGQTCINAQCSAGHSPPPPIQSNVDCATAVATGFEHSCAIRSDGTAWCWGSNEFGQLGNATDTVDHTTPVQVMGLTGVKAIAGGDDHTCAIDGTGTLWCWGHNDVGQLGNTRMVDSAQPTLVSGLTGHTATQLTVGDDHSCALLDDQSVVCWGDDSQGQLGDQAFGQRTSPFTVPGLGKVIAIEAGGDSTCAIDSSHVLWCWGANFVGQLATGGFNQQGAPMQVGTGIASFSIGEATSCAVTTTGQVNCAGDNGSDALGNFTPNGQSAVPVQAALPLQMTSLSVGDHFACAIDTNSTLWCWGTNQEIQFGFITPNQFLLPLRTSYTDVKAVAAGDGHICTLSQTGGIACSGRNNHGQLGNGQRTTEPVPQAVPGVKGIVSMAAGDGHTCAALDDGTTVCWGDNSVGELGDGTFNSHENPAVVEGVAGATQLVAGEGHTCALLPDHTVKCWGFNFHGQLGDGTFDTHGLARPVLDSTGKPLANVSQLAAGGDHTCALVGNAAAGNPIVCWGEDDHDELGDALLGMPNGGNTTTPRPVVVVTLATAIAAGSRHTCALSAAHKVTCWGDGGQGQLGAGDNQPAFAAVNLSNVDQIDTFDQVTCAHVSDGSVDCWGGGLLGNGQQFGSSTPAVTAHSGATKVVIGGSAGCLLTSTSSSGGPIQCWGSNFAGQVGYGGYDDQPQPLVIGGLNNVIDITGGDEHMCAVLADHTAVCWGNNEFGQLGAGEQAVSAPVAPMLSCPAK